MSMSAHVHCTGDKRLDAKGTYIAMGDSGAT